MKRFYAFALAICIAATTSAAWSAQKPWEVLLNKESGLKNWNAIGDANWRAEQGAIVADKGKGGFLVSKKSYGDFELRAEVWVDSTANSGIFIRGSDPATITAQNAYEVNLYDRRPDPVYATGGIVDVAKVLFPQKAGGKWNVMEITAQGTQLTVRLNGLVMAKGDDGKHAQGRIALQYGAGPEGVMGGPVKWRKVEIREL